MKLPLRFSVAISCVALSTLSAAAADYWVFLGTYTGEKSKGIYVSRLSDSGQVTPAELVTVTTNPSFLVVDPSNRYLYAANETDRFRGQETGWVSAYAVDATSGRLKPLYQVASGGRGPAHISIDRTGKTVLVANYGGVSLAAFPVKPDGSLGAATSVIQNHGSSVNAERQKAPHAHCIVPDPANNFALLCDLGLDEVLVYHLDAAAAKLTPNNPAFASVAPGSGPRHIAFRPDGKFAYVINELSCTLTTFAYDAKSGSLREVETVSTLPVGETKKPKYSTAEIAVHPSGKFVYGSNRGHNSISIFRVDENTGKLTMIDNVSTGGGTPRSFGIDPSGRFLLAANQEWGGVAVFRIDEQSGRLNPTDESIKVEKPVSVVFVPVAQ
jgi:6-phosphogluconolactonase